MALIAGMKLAAGMVLAYVLMQALSRAHRELIEERPWGQHVTSALVIMAAPALATALLIAPLGGALFWVRVAAFAALGLAHLAIAGRGAEEARRARRSFALIAGGTLAVSLLGLLR